MGSMRRRSGYSGILFLVLLIFCTGWGNSISYFAEVEDERDDVQFFSIADLEFYRRPGKGEIDILSVQSRQEGDLILLSMTMAGEIDKSGRSNYRISIVTEDNDQEDTYDSVTISYNGTASEIQFYQNQTSIDLKNGTTVSGNDLEFRVPQTVFKDAVVFELSADTTQWDIDDLETYMDSTIDLPFDDSGRHGQYYWIYYLVVCLIVVFAIVGFIINWKFKRLWKRNKSRFCLICGGLMQDGDVDCRFCGHRYNPVRK